MSKNNITLTFSRLLAIVIKVEFIERTENVQLISYTLLILGMIVKQRMLLFDNDYINAEVFTFVGWREHQANILLYRSLNVIYDRILIRTIGQQNIYIFYISKHLLNEMVESFRVFGNIPKLEFTIFKSI